MLRHTQTMTAVFYQVIYQIDGAISLSYLSCNYLLCGNFVATWQWKVLSTLLDVRFLPLQHNSSVVWHCCMRVWPKKKSVAHFKSTRPWNYAVVWMKSFGFNWTPSRGHLQPTDIFISNYPWNPLFSCFLWNFDLRSWHYIKPTNTLICAKAKKKKKGN